MTTRRLLALASLPVVLAACETAGTAAPRRRPIVVFFTQDSAALDENGVAIVESAAEAAKARPAAPITVLGFAGPAGSAAFNQALSDARARAVADMLVQNGVPRGRITVRPRGEVPFEAMPTESRRVEILIGG